MAAKRADSQTTRLDLTAGKRTSDQSAVDTRPQDQINIDHYPPSRPPPHLNYIPSQQFFDNPENTRPNGQTDVDSHPPSRSTPFNYVSSQQLFDHPYLRSSASGHNILYLLMTSSPFPISRLTHHDNLIHLVLNKSRPTHFPLESFGFHNFQASSGKRTLTLKYGNTK